MLHHDVLVLNYRYAFARGSKTDADMKGVLLTLFLLYLAMERFPSCFKALFLTFQLPELYINETDVQNSTDLTFPTDTV